MGTEWLDAHYNSVPSEQLVQLSDVSGATLIGSNITCTTGVYPAELQAIVRALAMLPLSLHMVIHTDSKASIAAVRSFEEQFNERRRMRMAARPILQLIKNLRERRRLAGGSSGLVHIAAHTINSDIHSIGNRLADLRANSSRGNLRSSPAGLKQLPLEACEMHFCITDHTNRLVIDDIRRTARDHTKQLTLQKWSAKKDLSGFFACEGVIELGRSTLRNGTAAHQSALVHLATNSVHFYWSDTDRGVSHLLQLECADCQVPLSVDHLAVCPSAASTRTHASLCTVVLQHLSAFPNCDAWRRVHHVGQSSLSDVLSSLFPLPVTATPEEVILHLPRCVIGGFTKSECTQAAQLLRFHTLEDGRLALDQLRLECLHFVYTHFQSLKPL
jgi:ribonuclease HI